MNTRKTDLYLLLFNLKMSININNWGFIWKYKRYVRKYKIIITINHTVLKAVTRGEWPIGQVVAEELESSLFKPRQVLGLVTRSQVTFGSKLEYTQRLALVSATICSVMDQSQPWGNDKKRKDIIQSFVFIIFHDYFIFHQKQTKEKN